MPNTNRVNQVAADQRLADGLTKNAGSLGTFGYGGKQLKPADVVLVLQGRISAAQAATAAKAGLNAAATTAKTEITSTRGLIKTVKQALRALYAGDITTLATFGLAPDKVPAPKPATKVEAALKAKATRTARGTKGKKQRLEIPPADETAAPAPPAAATTPTPASSTKAP
jgi:hypothetical protein